MGMLISKFKEIYMRRPPAQDQKNKNTKHQIQRKRKRKLKPGHKMNKYRKIRHKVRHNKHKKF